MPYSSCTVFILNCKRANTLEAELEIYLNTSSLIIVALLVLAPMAAAPDTHAQPSAGQAGEPPQADDGADSLGLVIVEPVPTAEQRGLREVEAYLNSIHTLTARFVQQGPDGSMMRGLFNLQRPGRVRFDYDGDVPILVVSDGETINLIDYEVGQVTRWPVNDTPLAMLVAGNVSFGANVYLSAQGPGELANMVAVTARDPANPAQGSLTLMFSANPGSDDSLFGELTLRAWQVVDAQGGLTTVSLTGLNLNPVLEASLWRFDDPRGERLSRRRRGR